MRMIIAFVQPFMGPQLVTALHQIPGLSGATFTDTHGFGRGRPGDTAMSEVLYGTAAKLRVEIAVRDDMEDVVVRAIRDAGHTGNRGDGKVYVLPLDRAVRVATGEEGENAV